MFFFSFKGPFEDGVGGTLSVNQDGSSSMMPLCMAQIYIRYRICPLKSLITAKEHLPSLGVFTSGESEICACHSRQILTGWNILSFFLPLGFAAFSILPFIPWSSPDFCSTIPILVQSVPSAPIGLHPVSCSSVALALVSSCTCKMVQFGQM